VKIEDVLLGILFYLTVLLVAGTLVALFSIALRCYGVRGLLALMCGGNPKPRVPLPEETDDW
jgi:hypothetical protein